MQKENAISAIEEMCGSSLPTEYKELFFDYPVNLKRDYLGDPRHGGPSDFELLADPLEVLELNERERILWSKSEHSELEFPPTFLLIGSDGGGDLFAIDSVLSASL